MVVTRRVDNAVDALAAARPRHLEVTTGVSVHESRYIVNSDQFHGTGAKKRCPRLDVWQCSCGDGTSDGSSPIAHRWADNREKRPLATTGGAPWHPSPTGECGKGPNRNLADGNRRDVQMMVMEPAAVLFNRGIVRHGDIRACRRQPCGQQPQVMTELAGKRRRGVVVRPMRQRQVMLRIEKIERQPYGQR